MPEVQTSNKWLWIGGAAIGAYFIYDYFKTQAIPPLNSLGRQLESNSTGAAPVLTLPTKTILTTTVHNAIDPTVGTTVTVPVTTTVDTFIKTPVAVGGSSNVPTTTPTTAPLSSNTPIKGTSAVLAPTQVVNPAIQQVPPAQTGGEATVIPLRPPSATELAPNLGQNMYKNTGPQGGAGSVAAQYIDPTQSAAVTSVLENFSNTPIVSPVVNLSSITTGSNYNGQIESTVFDNFGLTSTPDIAPTNTIEISSPYVVNAAPNSVQSVAYETNNYYTGAASDPLCTVYSTTASSVSTGSVQIGTSYVVSTPANDYTSGDQMAISNYMNPIQSYNYIDTLDTAIQLQSIPQGTVTIGSATVVSYIDPTTTSANSGNINTTSNLTPESLSNIDTVIQSITAQSVPEGVVSVGTPYVVYSTPAQSTPIYDFSSSNVAGSMVFAGGGSGSNVNYNSDSAF